MSNKIILRIVVLASVACWLVMVFTDLAILFSDLRGVQPDIPRLLPNITLDLFILSVFYYYKLKIERNEQLNFIDLLWRVFGTGLVSVLISLALRFLIYTLSGNKLSGNILFNYLIYQINFSLLVGFLMCAFTAWKRLIIYQKSKWVMRLWTMFELSMLFALIHDSLGIKINGVLWLFIPVNIVLLLLILGLSARMKWVAFLSFKQKLNSLLLIALIEFYIFYFVFTVTGISRVVSGTTTAFLNLQVHEFNLALILFIVIYSVLAFLVIGFNLPTSSVFEQKLEEVVNFQRIGQSIQTEKNEESVYQILLDSAVKSVFADAAWIEVQSSEEKIPVYLYGINSDEAAELRGLIREHGVVNAAISEKNNMVSLTEIIQDASFSSMMIFPIQVKGEQIGSLALLKEIQDGFTKEMRNMVFAFVNQAGISIENFRLMEEALQNERYKEELKIAKTVQKSLLPEKLEHNSDFEIAAFSESADEVGGDYYDTLKISNSQVAAIIADVSGKGTTAAFHMSQMKGIFHSLAQQEFNPSEFLKLANRALNHCLERGSFISAVYFTLDSITRQIHYARAGHCPILFYSKEKGRATFLSDRGTALGMVKDARYDDLIESHGLSYRSGDILLLYTDGVIESRNKAGEDFGYDRLIPIVEAAAASSASEIQKTVIRALYSFTEHTELNDDYTLLVIKFI